MIKRFATLLPVVFGVLCLTFALLHLVPGDPVDVMLGESASAADRTALKAQLGLDQPVLVQFGQYVMHLLQGDFGTSIHTQTPISQLLWQAYPATLLLAVVALGCLSVFH